MSGKEPDFAGLLYGLFLDVISSMVRVWEIDRPCYACAVANGDYHEYII